VKIAISRESPVPIRDQLIEQIGLQIAAGLLRGEEKLPSIRALAQRLGIHYNTVSSAYTHLAEVGLLDIRQGSGVRVASKVRRRAMELEEAGLDDLLKDFLAIAAEHGYTRTELKTRFAKVLDAKPAVRLLVVDRNPDFHKLLLAELKPHFKLPVETTTAEQLSLERGLIDDSLIVTSLYHVFSLQAMGIEPTRLVVCHVEPARAEMELVSGMPSGSLILLVSVSPTLLRMATNVVAAVRGEEIAVRTVPLDDQKELTYVLPYADAVICDGPSRATVTKLRGKPPDRVFQLYSQSTIDLVKDRLSKWG
jgi:DNA-binding transcriptional regulator YhcF (GntR family)